MDLTIDKGYEEFRQGVRDFLESHRDEAPSAKVGAGRDERVMAWQKILVENGFVGRTVPEEYGGFGAAPDILENIIIDEEFAAADAYRGIENQGISMFVPTLLEYGREDQKQDLIGRTLSAELIWCQGYSEPGSGSDLASLTTRAHVDGDDFVINGQKIWTSGARDSEMMFALVRTEADASKHAGISYLILRTDTPGLEIRPLMTMNGDATFNEVFFTDARVPRSQIVGQRGQGWEVGTYTLRHERNMLGRSGQTEAFMKGCVAILNDTGLVDDPIYQDRFMRLEGRVQAMKYHGLRMLTDRLKGRDSGVSGLITKLNGCQINYDICNLAIDALGEIGVLHRDSLHVRDAGAWQTQGMYALGLIIGGGTEQIQKNIISEVGLGMPREPKAR